MQNSQPEQTAVIGPSSSTPTLGKEPLNFTLPAFDRDVSQTLENQTQPSPAQRRRIVDGLFQAMILFTIYPSRRFYVMVASAFVGKYHHLRDSLGSGFDSWVALLRMKFKNSRRSMETSEVVSKREKHGKKGTKRTATIDDDNQAKLQRISALNDAVDLGEDAKSLQMHQKWLQREFLRKKKDDSLVSERMRLTFADRQKVLQDHTVAEAVKLYPFLQDEDQFLSDFDKLVGKSIDKEFLGSLKRYHQAVFTLASKEKQEELKILKENLSLDEDVKKYQLAVAVVPIIVGHFKEDLTMLIQKDGIPTAMTPVIIYEGSSMETAEAISVFVEKQKLVETPDLLLGLECLLAAYWLFNIRYNEKVYNTLTLLELLFLKLSYTRPRPTVIRTVTKLEKH